jgi:dihydrofolate reductase
MKLSIVVAMCRNRVIGRDNAMPWHLPADLGHFKKITMGKPIVMGRKTFESIGRPLPGRHNIVITRDAAYAVEGCTVVNSVDAALEAAGDAGEVMVVGGANLYEQLLPRVDTIHLTEIHAEPEGDTFFPEINDSEWREVEREDFSADDKNPHDYSFVKLERVS